MGASTRSGRVGNAGIAIAVTVLGTLGLAGCSSSGAASAAPSPAGRSGARSAVTPGPVIDATTLGSLTNYSFTATADGVTSSGSVHSPTDWRNDQPSEELHIDGFSYVRAGSSWSKGTDSPGAYRHSSYLGAVDQFVGFAKIAGARVAEGAPCDVDGTAGRTWTVRTAKNGSSILAEQASACVADSGGALLSLTVGAGGDAVPGAPHSLSTTFTVTGIGSVPQIAVPAPLTGS